MLRRFSAGEPAPESWQLDTLAGFLFQRRELFAGFTRVLWLGWTAQGSALARLSRPLIIRLIQLSLPLAPADWDRLIAAAPATSAELASQVLQGCLVDVVYRPSLEAPPVPLRPAPGGLGLLGALGGGWPDPAILELGGPAVCAVLAGWRMDRHWPGRVAAMSAVSQAVASGELFPHCLVDLLEHLATTPEGRATLAAGNGLSVVLSLAQLCLSQMAGSALRILCQLLMDESPEVTETLCRATTGMILKTLFQQLNEFEPHAIRWLAEALSCAIGPDPRCPKPTWQAFKVVIDPPQYRTMYSWLLQLLLMDNELIRAQAAKGLAALCADLDPLMAGTVLALCHDHSAAVRWAVAQAVAVLAGRSEMHILLLKGQPDTTARGFTLNARELVHKWAGWASKARNKLRLSLAELEAGKFSLGGERWSGAKSICQLCRDTRAHEPILFATLKLAKEARHHIHLASAGVIDLCGRVAQQLESPPGVLLLALRNLIQFANSPEHRTQAPLRAFWRVSARDRCSGCWPGWAVCWSRALARRGSCC